MLERIQDTIRRFGNCSSDLLSSTAATFENAINAFVHLCETDEVMSGICNPLKENEKVDVGKWYRELPETGRFVTPIEDEDKLAFLYQLILAVQAGKINVPYLGANLFHSTSMQAMVAQLNNAVSRPLTRELQQRLDDLKEQEYTGPNVVGDTVAQGDFSVQDKGTATIDFLDQEPDVETETQKIIEGLAVRYQELGEKSDKERHYSRRLTFSFYALAGGLIYTLFLVSPTIVLGRLLFPTYIAAGLLWEAISVVFMIYFSRRYAKYKLDKEQTLFLYVYSLASELRQYPTPVPISDASDDLEFITSRLETIWPLRFRIAKAALSSLTDLTKYLRHRLMPALKTGNTDDVKLSAWVLAKLCPLLTDDSPQISAIEELNKALSKIPEPTSQPEDKFYVKVKKWWGRHSSLRWVGAALVCTSVAIAIVLVGQAIGYLQGGFLAGVGAGVALFVGYLTSTKRKTD